jgi:hypothetical protein
LTASDARGACRCFVYLLQDTTRISQEQLSGRTQLHAARQTFKQFETDFLLQVLNLSGERRLRDAQPARRTPVVLLLPDGKEIS